MRAAPVRPPPPRRPAGRITIRVAVTAYSTKRACWSIGCIEQSPAPRGSLHPRRAAVELRVAAILRQVSSRASNASIAAVDAVNAITTDLRACVQRVGDDLGATIIASRLRRSRAQEVAGRRRRRRRGRRGRQQAAGAGSRRCSSRRRAGRSRLGNEDEADRQNLRDVWIAIAIAVTSPSDSSAPKAAPASASKWTSPSASRRDATRRRGRPRGRRGHTQDALARALVEEERAGGRS